MYCRRVNTYSIAVLIAMSAACFQTTHAVLITNPVNFTAPMQVIDYFNSPVGTIAGGTSIINQYAALGVIHDGSTTTPPGPGGMSSFSGLPGLESPAGDPDPNLPITVTFTVPVTQIGAFYLMGSSSDSITISAFRADTSLIESHLILPANMQLTPGTFGFNEGFIGVILGESAASVIFAPSSSAFVIDDLHFGGTVVIPEPSSIAIWSVIGGIGLIAGRRKRRRKTAA